MENRPLLRRNDASINDDQRDAIGFGDALKIPGVVEFSLSLFFSKLVSYTFLYWLPLYIQSSSKLKPLLSISNQQTQVFNEIFV